MVAEKEKMTLRVKALRREGAFRAADTLCGAPAPRQNKQKRRIASALLPSF